MFFQELLNSLDSKQCAISMLEQKFEKLDTDFINKVDIYSIWNSARQKEESSEEEPQSATVKVNGQEYVDINPVKE
jgi:hypothetical protein